MENSRKPFEGGSRHMQVAKMEAPTLRRRANPIHRCFWCGLRKICTMSGGVYACRTCREKS